MGSGGLNQKLDYYALSLYMLCKKVILLHILLFLFYLRVSNLNTRLGLYFANIISESKVHA